MHVDKPKDQHLAGHAIKKTHPRSLSIPIGHTNQNFSLTLLSFLLRKELEAVLSPLSHTHGSNTKRRKAINSPFPLTPTSLVATRSFFQSFSSSCSQLKARVILALSLQEFVSRVRGNSNSFSLLSILNLSDGYMNLYMGVLCWIFL